MCKALYGSQCKPNQTNGNNGAPPPEVRVTRHATSYAHIVCTKVKIYIYNSLQTNQLYEKKLKQKLRVTSHTHTDRVKQKFLTIVNPSRITR